MSDEASLERKLERLSASGIDTGASRTLSGDREALLRQILNEIDDIVLGRSLRLEASATRAVTVEVTGRRILKVLGDVGAATGNLEGRSLDVEGGSDATALRGYFDALIGSAKTVRATMQPLGRTVSAGEMGLSARSLADAWSIALEPRADADGDALAAGLIADLGDAVLGWRMIGADPESGGADSSTEALAGLPLDPGTGLLPPDSPNAVTVIQRASDAIAIVRIAGATLALHLTAQAAPRAVELWRRAVAF